MPLIFTVEEGSSYFVSRYIGEIVDGDLIPPWKEFLERPDWNPSLNELCDLSESDLSRVTPQGIQNFAMFSNHFYTSRGLEEVKVAVYAPKDLPFGLARMYESRSFESPEKLRIFRDLESAKKWLTA